MQMKFTETRVLHIKYAPGCKAEYRWRGENGQWRLHRHTPDFFEYNIPAAFTEAERLLLEIKFSGNDR